MTYVLDASAMIALLRGEPGGEIVSGFVLDRRNGCFAYGLNLCEVYYDFHRASGVDAADAAIEALLAAGICFRPAMDTGFWKEAGILKANWRRISLADCFAVTLSKRLEAELVTADRHELEPLSDGSAVDLHSMTEDRDSELSTEYYDVAGFCAIRREGDYAVHASITRRDTGEHVQHVSSAASDELTARSQLDDAVRSHLELLDRPTDWGRDPTVPGLIRDYLAAKERILNEALETYGSEGDLFDADYATRRASMDAEFSRRVSHLSPEQQLALVTLTDRERHNPSDIWVMDEMIAKFRLYSCIENPTPQLKEQFVDLASWWNR